VSGATSEYLFPALTALQVLPYKFFGFVQDFIKNCPFCRGKVTIFFIRQNVFSKNQTFLINVSKSVTNVQNSVIKKQNR